jgi:hypothetical protein
MLLVLLGSELLLLENWLLLLEGRGLGWCIELRRLKLGLLAE